MAVEIIKPGRPEWQQCKWVVVCRSCGCEFSFLGSDAERWSAPRNEEGLRVHCPHCHRHYHTNTIFPPAPPRQGPSNR